MIDSANESVARLKAALAESKAESCTAHAQTDALERRLRDTGSPNMEALRQASD